METSSRLRQRLKNFGFSDPAVEAAWPAWWSEDADASLSASTDLRFSIARKLGLDPKSLLDDDGEPSFIWRDYARFKRLREESDVEKAAITSFGTSLGGVLLSAMTDAAPRAFGDAISLRNAILRSQTFVRLVDLLSVCWSVGIPVIHLRVFPWPQKRMSAMTVNHVDYESMETGAAESDSRTLITWPLRMDLLSGDPGLPAAMVFLSLLFVLTLTVRRDLPAPIRLSVTAFLVLAIAIEAGLVLQQSLFLPRMRQLYRSNDGPKTDPVFTTEHGARVEGHGIHLNATVRDPNIIVLLFLSAFSLLWFKLERRTKVVKKRGRPSPGRGSRRTRLASG